MRRLAVNVLAFGLFFLMIIRVAGIWDNIDRDKSVNPNILRMQNVYLFDSLDILFVGSSALYSGINPAYFDSIGLRTYNLGLAAAGPYFYELLLNDYIASVKQKPKTVFFLIMPSTFMSRIDRFEEVGIHRYLCHPLTNEELVKRYSLWCTYPSLLIKSFQKGIKNLIYSDKASPVTIQEALKNKGFYSSDEVTSYMKEQKEKEQYQNWKLDTFSMAGYEYLEKYAASVRQRGIEVAFFSVPGNKVSGFFTNEFIQKYQAVLNRLQTRYKLYDLSAMQLDSSCFRNSDHLNTRGAGFVSKEMIALLLKDRDMKKRLH